MAKAVRRALQRIKEAVSINAMAVAVSNDDVRAAMAHVSETKVREALEPSSAIAADASERGGKVAAEQINRVLA